MTNEDIVKTIQSTFPDLYRDDQIHVLVSALEQMTPLINYSLDSFIQTHSHQEIILLGYSVEILKKDHGMNEIAAYLTLDWIIREPEEALQSLKKGHDTAQV